MEEFEVVDRIYVDMDKMYKYTIRNAHKTRVLYSPRMYTPGQWIKVKD